MNVSISINGETVSREVEPRTLLVHFIRDTPGLTGTHWGCDTSSCGACVVQIDGEPVKSCTTLAVMCEGHEVRTVESLEVDGKLDPIQMGSRDLRAVMRLLHAGDADDDRCSTRTPIHLEPRSVPLSQVRDPPHGTRTSWRRALGCRVEAAAKQEV